MFSCLKLVEGIFENRGEVYIYVDIFNCFCIKRLFGVLLFFNEFYEMVVLSILWWVS